VLEAAMRFHAAVQRILTRVAERRVAQVVGERDCLDQILVEAQIARNRARDLSNFQAVREPGAEQVAFVIDEYLGFVLQTAKCGGMDDPVAIALELAAAFRRRFAPAPAARVVRAHRKRRELRHARTTPPGPPSPPRARLLRS
jgi:hypothetical protein